MKNKNVYSVTLTTEMTSLIDTSFYRTICFLVSILKKKIEKKLPLLPTASVLYRILFFTELKLTEVLAVLKKSGVSFKSW